MASCKDSLVYLLTIQGNASQQLLEVTNAMKEYNATRKSTVTQYFASDRTSTGELNPLKAEKRL